MVILCNTFQDVMDAFSIFMDYLEHCYPMGIQKIFEYGYGVETDEGIRYVFTCYEYEKVFISKGYDPIEVGRFLEDIESDYITQIYG